MPTLPQGRLWVLSSSIVLSCVVMGMGISLLHAGRPPMYQYQYTDIYDGTVNNWSQPRPQPQPQPNHPNLSPRDPNPGPGPGPGPYFADNDEFRISEILAIASSALNLFVATALIVVSAMKRKTIISTVAVEAPCIFVVSFMWLSTAAYAEHINDGRPGFFPYLTLPECTRHKVLEGIAFINWIQLMLYANTLMTVATICHVRKRSVWLHSITELPTLGAPALTFDSEMNPPFMTKTNESEVPILGTPRPNVSSRPPSHFRSRLTFPQPLSAVPSPLPTSESVESLAPSVSSTQPDVSSQSPVSYHHPRTYHRIVPMGEPPTYSDPGAGYESEAV